MEGGVIGSGTGVGVGLADWGATGADSGRVEFGKPEAELEGWKRRGSIGRLAMPVSQMRSLIHYPTIRSLIRKFAGRVFASSSPMHREPSGDSLNGVPLLYSSLSHLTCIEIVVVILILRPQGWGFHT